MSFKILGKTCKRAYSEKPSWWIFSRDGKKVSSNAILQFLQSRVEQSTRKISSAWQFHTTYKTVSDSTPPPLPVTEETIANSEIVTIWFQHVIKYSSSVRSVPPIQSFWCRQQPPTKPSKCNHPRLDLHFAIGNGAASRLVGRYQLVIAIRGWLDGQLARYVSRWTFKSQTWLDQLQCYGDWSRTVLLWKSGCSMWHV